MTKVKLHVLTHLVDDIRRFGPAVRYATEIFECFNHIFRLCSILSNHQAPSRDTAIKLAGLDRLKHIVSGGYWREEESWRNASDNVWRYLTSRPELQTHLGWAPASTLLPGWSCSVLYTSAYMNVGSTKAHVGSRGKVIPWNETLASKNCPVASSVDPCSAWKDGKTTISTSGDDCRVGSWVMYKDLSTQVTISSDTLLFLRT
jgi:hypothetical protein